MGGKSHSTIAKKTFADIDWLQFLGYMLKSIGSAGELDLGQMTSFPVGRSISTLN